MLISFRQVIIPVISIFKKGNTIVLSMILAVLRKMKPTPGLCLHFWFGSITSNIVMMS